MWLFTPFGFFSVVAKGAPGQLCVRSRWRRDLEGMRTRYAHLMTTMTDIEAHTGTDYQFRFYVDREEFADVMWSVARGVEASNFKSAVGKVDVARASLLGRIWHTIADAAPLLRHR